jgi:hypothetical protein
MAKMWGARSKISRPCDMCGNNSSKLSHVKACVDYCLFWKTVHFEAPNLLFCRKKDKYNRSKYELSNIYKKHMPSLHVKHMSTTTLKHVIFLLL